MKFRFNYKYGLITILLFLVEVLIAMYVHDEIIRPYIGDVIVIGLIYCFLRTFLEARTLWMVLGVFLFACLIELGQYFDFVELLGLSDNRLARIVLGTTFSWEDILAYALGSILVYGMERMFGNHVD